MNFELFSPLLQDLINSVVLAVISAVGVVVLYYTKLGIEYLKVKMGMQNFDLVKGIVVTLVKAYEQNPIFGELLGEEKKEAVIAQVTKYCAEHKIPVTHEMIDNWVEEAVLEMNAAVDIYSEDPALDFEG